MQEFDLIVIGAGPGGYVAAIRAAQLGLSVACVEFEKALGGTCLRVGCIPSKALLESSEKYEEIAHGLTERGIVTQGVSLDLPKMMQHKTRVVTTLTGGIDSLFKKNKITRFFGYGQLIGSQQVSVTAADKTVTQIQGKNILIATGSVPSSLPGIEIDGDRIVSSTEALSFPEVPKTLVVIGAGVIGLEMGTIWRRLGSKVIVLEYLPRIMPGADGEIAKIAQKILEKQGLEFRLGCKVTGIKKNQKTVDVQIEGQDAIRCDRALVAVGRKPMTSGLGLDVVKVELDKRGFIKVNEGYQTSVPGIYAIGDVIGGAMLAHKAEDEGMACVEKIVTGYAHVNYLAIPAVVYTDPEIASVGYTEEQLIEKGIQYNKGSFPFMANGRAKAIGKTEGQVKMLADAKTDRILGVHIVGPHAGDLIAEVATGIEFGASSEDIARSSHAHPTLAEAVKEAALAVSKRAIHF
jgi:dihydrolipoamide dehydrogenase